MERGADLAWLSTAPNEQEWLYPPCTYLKPTGRSQRVKVTDELYCLVVEVTPRPSADVAIR